MRAVNTEAFLEAISGLANERQELILRNPNDFDAVPLGFSRQEARRLVGGNEKSPWPFVLVCSPVLQQSPRLSLRRLGKRCGDGCSTQNEAARGVHEGNKVKVAVFFGVDCVFRRG